jgi:hypothetical protein
MTVAEIAAQMGVTPETLVQEVVAKGATIATVWVVLGALFTIFAIVSTIFGFIRDDTVYGLVAVAALMFGAFLLIADSPNLIAWKTAPETTANQYIVEHYGGGQE